MGDLLETLTHRPGCAVNVHPGQYGDFEVNAADTPGRINVLLRRQREGRGLS
jgi:hypothetical protein